MSRRFRFVRNFGATGQVFAPKAILNGLGADLDALKRIGGTVAALGPLAPPCVARPYFEMRNALGNMIANLGLIAQAMPAGDAKNILGVAVQQLALKLAATPAVDQMWTTAPPQWQRETYHTEPIPLPPTGRAFKGPAGPPLTQYMDVDTINWPGVSQRSREVVTAATTSLFIASIGTFSAPVLSIGFVVVETVNYVVGLFESEDTEGAVVPQTFQQLYAEFQSKFRDEFLPEVYQQTRAVTRAAQWAESLRGTPSEKAEALAQHMAAMDPRREPTMPANWNGSLPDLARTSSTTRSVVAVLLGAAVTAGVLWALEDD